MIKNCKLLIDEPTLQFQPRLAAMIGLNGAIFLQQLQFWLKVQEQQQNADHFHEGRWWIYNSYTEWRKKNFPFWSTRTLMRIVDFLRDELHILISRPDLELGGRNWYTIDYDELARIDILPLVQEQEPVEIDAPAPEKKPEPVRQIGPTHFRGHAYRHASKSSVKRPGIPPQIVAPSPSQVDTGPCVKLSRGPVSSCHGTLCQVVPPSTRTLKRNLSTSEISTENSSEKPGGRAFESPPAVSPFNPPQFFNTWAMPAWRDRILAARAQFRKERPL